MKPSLLIALCLSVLVAKGQTTLPPIPPGQNKGVRTTDTLALFKQFQTAVNTYNPIWVLVPSGKNKVAYRAAFQRGDGTLCNLDKSPFSQDAIIFGFTSRKERDSVERKGK